ncbi:phage tail protein [Ruminiclostridium cellulolyticum]|uniref:Phage-related protein-like protein n=1 Tax=Ruminiclostridium cellulolyticum (strain ATCC 35319 / DSM 5812 / JCM 6584 / H10) TaxID=394503 RepID=B8I8Z5_RUMCH|nr:hypothetical protein [Ruminiclostridium cellulolyticum]ACL77327.1 Phage-related protein-like protein [Ruminiclostridium cellulolyticum H10]
MSNGSVGQIALDLGVNYDGFNKQLSGIAGNATNMVGASFKKLGGIVAAAFAVDKLIDFGRQSMELASNLTEVQNVVDVTFGSMAADINAWSKNMLSGFGLSELSAKKYSSTLGAMMKSSGLVGTQMEGMSKKLTELSADMASFYNLSNDEAFEKIRSGISGETEPLKQLGVNMSVANMEAYALTQGIKKQYSEMSQAQQTLLRYNYLLSVTKDAQGDFARTSGSWANQIKLLGEQWNIFKGSMGAGFINILAPIVRGLNFLISKLQIAAQYFKAFTALLFGDASGGSVSGAANNAASATSDMGTAAGGAGKEVKKAGKDVKGALGGFDQLNTLAMSAADSMDDAGSAAGGLADMGGMGDMNLGGGNIDIGIDPSKLKPLQDILNNIKSIASQVAGYFVANFGPPIAQAISAISVPLQGWKTAIADAFSQFQTLGEPLKQWFVGDFTTQIQTGIKVTGNVLAGLLDTGLKVFNTIKEVAFPIVSWFVTDGLPMISQFTTQWGNLFQNMFDSTKQIFDMLWDQGVAPGLRVVSGMILDTLNIIKGFWDDWGGKIFEGLNGLVGSIKSVMTNLWQNFLQPIWQNICETISWLWSKHLKGLIKEITDFVGKLVTAVLDITNKFITPLVNMLIKVLGPTWSNIFNGIVNVIGTVVGTIVDVIKGLIKSLGGLVDFIAGVFTGDWKRAWTGIKDFFKGIFDSIVGIFKGAINLIVDAFNFMIGALNNIQIKIPDWSPIGGGKSFGINIPKIPKLANGGLVSAPTLAMVGDNRNAQADPEVVSPLSKLQGMLNGGNQEVVAAINELMELIRNLQTPVIMKVGETEFGKAVIRTANVANRQSGYTLFEV